MTQHATGYFSGHENPGVAAIVLLLDGWLRALNDGTVGLRLPGDDIDPLWTEEYLAAMVADIDRTVDRELPRDFSRKAGVTKGPEFKRLAYPQQIALAQQLRDVVEQYRTELVSTEATMITEVSEVPQG